MKPAAITLVWGLSTALAACAQREPEARWLQLEQFRPANTTGVFLNEPLVFHFSEGLDPTSVLPTAVQIVARNGERTRARGDWLLAGNKLTFQPAPVLAPDLSDGGYLPDTTYDISLAGFPRLDALRDLTGVPLERSLSLTFTTVDPAAPESGFVFEDASMDVGLPLFLQRDRVEPGAPILLEGEEPIDPSTLFDDDFALYKQIESGENGSKRPEPIGVRARLLDNRNRRAARWGEGTTLISLQPLEKLEPGARYRLLVGADLNQAGADLRLRDFGGHRVLVRSRTRKNNRIYIDVASHAFGAPGSYFEHTETFMTPELRSIEPPGLPDLAVDAPLGVDGTLYWGTSGRVELLWPAAAGTGRDGFVELGATDARTDLHATRVRVAAGVTCELDAPAGPVVVRAQGKLLIEGSLVRLGSGEPVEDDSAFVPLEVPAYAADPAAREEPIEALSDWLARTIAAGTPCLVLIAGGDLVIHGSVEADCPVLLVAGGRLRVGGRVLRAPRVFTLGEGAGNGIEFAHPEGTYYTDPARLELDEPRLNQLAVPLVFGVRSSSIPPLGGAERWHDSPKVGLYKGGFGPAEAFVPQTLVQFLGERADPERGPAQMLVPDPVLLVDCPTLKLDLTIIVGPGEVWDPPWIDSVQVRWDSPRGGTR